MPVPLPPIDSRFSCFGNEPADADYRRPGPSADDDVMRCINWDWTDGDSRCQSLTAFIYPHLLVIYFVTTLAALRCSSVLPSEAWCGPGDDTLRLHLLKVCYAVKSINLTPPFAK
jgi:hypothetical protein